ncbi:response regulator transcription factor [Actinoallomurus iriomotensis]|uniref:DNA-binding response regulator n=1 Tax=Actinoallomurus iriomotensis TaxID=478107 RepID=A0A9W6S442_9ACTN|nr:response regulator transcription factor [Actinoallomurus iriomotensis]GLY88241.1 DNA-binding response regulator [Actinoallomurus iriomotensis]
MTAGVRRRLRVLITEDTRLRSNTLAALVRREDGVQLVAQATTGRAVLAAATECRPDVAVLDIDLLGIEGLTVIEELRALLPRCKVIIVTGVIRPGHLRRAIAANVSGLIVKDVPGKQLLDAIDQAGTGARVIAPQLAMAALDAESSPLSSRETEILQRYAGGYEIPEIAAQVCLSGGTVRNYLASATGKLGARNRAHAVRIAAEAGWL